jgi:hypothetical protein
MKAGRVAVAAVVVVVAAVRVAVAAGRVVVAAVRAVVAAGRVALAAVRVALAAVMVALAAVRVAAAERMAGAQGMAAVLCTASASSRTLSTPSTKSCRRYAMHACESRSRMLECKPVMSA